MRSVGTVAFGLTLVAAVALPEAGTSNAARLLGLEDQIGTIEKGKIADLVAVPGDPLQDIGALGRPVFVMHEGRIVVSK